MSEKGILKKIDDIFNYCEEIDNHLPKEEQTGYRMLPDIFYIQKEVRNLQQKVDRLNNILDELEKYLIEHIDEYRDMEQDAMFEFGLVLDKLKALKENNNV